MTLTIEAVAERYGVTPRTVRGWVDAGELAAFTVSRTAGSQKRRLRFTEQALQRFEYLRSASPANAAVRTPRRRKRRDKDVIEFYK